MEAGNILPSLIIDNNSMIRPSIQNKEKHDRIVELCHKINWGRVQADLENTYCLYDDEIEELEKLCQ